MVLSRNKKNNVYPCKLQFYYIKVGFKGVNIIQECFRDGELHKKQLNHFNFSTLNENLSDNKARTFFVNNKKGQQLIKVFSQYN